MATPPKTFSINDNRKCSSSTRKIFFCLWIVFWLILNTQSGAYMFIHRVVVVAFQVIGANNLTSKVLTETFTLTLIRSTSFVTETSTHFMLVLTIRSTLTRFCLYLEPIDHLLGRPPLTGVRKSSVAALAFIFYTVYQPSKYFPSLKYFYNIVYSQHGFYHIVGASPSH